MNWLVARRRSWLLAALIAAGLPHAALGQTPLPTLRGVTKVTTALAVIFPEGEKRPSSLTEDRLRTIIELRLRTAGLRVLSTDEETPHTNPFVYLQVTCLVMNSQSGWNPGYAFSTRLSVGIFQSVTFNGAWASSELWWSDNLAVTNPDRVNDVVERQVGALLDALLNQWLADNPVRR